MIATNKLSSEHKIIIKSTVTLATSGNQDEHLRERKTAKKRELGQCQDTCDNFSIFLFNVVMINVRV